MSRFAEVVDRLAAVIESRRGADPAQSWSARLLADRRLAAKKMAEEAVETALAAATEDTAAFIAESADLLYHFLALLAASGVSLEEVASELERREGRSGLDEKASRGR
ncbi:MAG TPA: phosphoribosyl-ATP diphosphatase [Caulobacteraceae bacterium]|nr:phosphoribosyl-ATP diphosphatase [Caulobacteraceae bacterium]